MRTTQSFNFGSALASRHYAVEERSPLIHGFVIRLMIREACMQLIKHRPYDRLYVLTRDKYHPKSYPGSTLCN